ncbi:MAG: DUF3833 family protein [Sphingomonas sp.]
MNPLVAALANAALVVVAAAPPPLDLPAFLTGRSHADNQLKIIFHGACPLIVDSVGRREGAAFVQVDTVHECDKPVRTRVWRMHEISPSHYGGTLSDAAGPVDIAVSGNAATIRYKMKGGLDIVETMQLQRDGKTLSNHVVAKKFGLTFAHVDGTIRKLD